MLNIILSVTIIFLFVHGNQALQCNTRTEKVNPCGNKCEPTCTNVLHKSIPCSRVCAAPACVCRDGWARHQGGCRPKAECPEGTLTCQDPAKEQISICGNLCEPTCENRDPSCARICKPPECICKEGLFRLNNRCVPANECP